MPCLTGNIGTQSLCFTRSLPWQLLPRDDPKSPETPAETAFRTRMVALLQRLQQVDAPSEDATQPQAPASGGSGDRAGGGGNSHSNGGSHPRGSYRRRQVADMQQTARNSNLELINIVLEAMEKVGRGRQSIQHAEKGLGACQHLCNAMDAAPECTEVHRWCWQA